MDGWMDRRTDERMDGWMDGWILTHIRLISSRWKGHNKRLCKYSKSEILTRNP